MTHTAQVSPTAAAMRDTVTEAADITPGGMVVTTHRRALHPMERMRIRGQITIRQAAAGERLYASWALGVVGARDPEESGGCSAWSPAGYTDAQLAALEDFREAQVAVMIRPGPAAWDLLVYVCCSEMTVRGMVEPGPSGKASGRRVNALMDLLREGLFRLAEHYGIPDVE